MGCLRRAGIPTLRTGCNAIMDTQRLRYPLTSRRIADSVPFWESAGMIQHSKHLTSLLCSAGLVVGLGGCSTLEKHIPGVGAVTSETSGSAAVEGVFYAALPDLPFHRSPGGAIIKHLPQYTKLYRDQLDRGFAHVRVESTGETGWVENAQLLWRPPKHRPPQQAQEPTSQPVAESPLPQVVEPPQSSAPQAVEPSPHPVEPPTSPAPQAAEVPQSPSPQPMEAPPPSSRSPSTAPAKGTVAPSIFNPY